MVASPPIHHERLPLAAARLRLRHGHEQRFRFGSRTLAELGIGGAIAVAAPFCRTTFIVDG
jgi:hypothetical protein